MSIAERMRGKDAEVVEARSRQGRFRKSDEHLDVKDILVGHGPTRQRSVMVRNLQQATRDAYTRDRLVALLQRRIEGSGTSNSSTCARSTTVAATGSSPTCSCAGWRCC